MAVAILGVTALALFEGFSTGWATVATVREDLRATQILTQKTEAVRLLTWAELTNCPTTFEEYYYPLGGTNSGVMYYGTMSATGTATNLTDAIPKPLYANDVLLVTVDIYWTNNIGNQVLVHHREAQTLSAYDGMQSYFYGYNR
ncbi:MAG: hypothetical protein KGR98_10885 [Verrucomicrobia bacterium]|nr:hypothetical protein [Verrucomicrobiota bacterium]MDE3098935.1 hypothetical protein [Verrucomicrobiota bacterium]